MNGASRRAMLVSLAAAAAGAHQARGARLELMIRALKPAFRTGEPVLIEGRLANVSAAPLTVNRRFAFPGPDVFLRAADEAGRTLGWLPPEPPPPLTPADFTRLPPGGVLEFRLPDLRSWVQNSLPEARYRVTATYHNHSGPEAGMKTSEDVVESAPIEVHVVR